MDPPTMQDHIALAIRYLAEAIMYPLSAGDPQGNLEQAHLQVQNAIKAFNEGQE